MGVLDLFGDLFPAPEHLQTIGLLLPYPQPTDSIPTDPGGGAEPHDTGAPGVGAVVCEGRA